MSILAVVYLIIMAILGLLILIDCIRYRKNIKSYVKYGVMFGFVFLALEVFVLALVPAILKHTSISVLVATEALGFVKIVLFTCMGMYCFSIYNSPNIPLVRELVGKSSVTEKTFGIRYIAPILIVAAAATLYSIILFKLTAPQPSAFIKALSQGTMTRLGIGDRPSLTLALAFLQFAFVEEIIFRLGIQNYLAKQFKLKGQKYWLAILLTAGLWSLAHANILEPEWVKLAQIFPLGVALGVLFRKYGTESCIFTHGIFNLIMMFLASYLMPS